MTTRGFASIGLVSPKDRANIGGVLRAASAFSASMVAVEGARGHHTLTSIPSDTARAYKHIPVIRVDDVFDAHPAGAIPVAVELCDTATLLSDFEHPLSAYYIFGPEDGSLGKRVLDRCPHHLYIPTKHCLNLAATVNIVLYDRQLQTHRRA